MSADQSFVHPEFLVSGDWLAAHLDDPSVRVLDVTAKLNSKFVNRAQQDCFDIAHIPGARFVDVGGGHGEFHDPDAALPWTWPTPKRFEALMARLDIGHGTRVVLVAATPRPGIDSGTMWCTRAWWTMHHMGVNCAILEGGMERWTAEGRPLVEAAPSPLSPAAGRTADPFRVSGDWERGRAGRADVTAALDSPGGCVVDALAADSFDGTAPGYGARKGHITGARNVPFRTLITAETAAFRPPAEIHAALAAQGLFGQDRIVTYCGGAIAATTTAFALALFGHPDVAVYDGSLMEWSNDPNLPMTDPSAADPGDGR